MSCVGFDIYSPFVFIGGAGVFLGAAFSSFVRGFLSKGKKRSRTVAGLYFYLSLFFFTIFLSVFFLDIPSLEYRRLYIVFGSVAFVLGGAAASWKRIVGAVLVVLIVALYVLLSFFVADMHCSITEDPILEIRVLSRDKSAVSMEVQDAGGRIFGHKELEGIFRSEASERAYIGVIYRKVAFAEWMCFPRRRYLYRIEGFLSDNTDKAGPAMPLNAETVAKSNWSPIDSMVHLMPFVSITEKILRIPEPERFDLFRIYIEGDRLELEKSTW